MSPFDDLIQLVRHPDKILESIGNHWSSYALLMGIIFSETGLLIGFFLPGDSLLVTTGFMVSGGFLSPFGLDPLPNLLLLNALLIVMAIVGDAVGFWIGLKAGPAIFKREKSFFFRKDHLLSTQRFYEKHGGKTIILARFMPFARTFAPVVAGVGKMPYSRFAMFNVVGGVGWVLSMTVLGYALGNVIPAKTLEYVIYLVVFLSIAPLLVSFIVKKMKQRRDAKAGIVTGEPAAPAAKEPPAS